jgi:hypothetical protein
MTSLWKHQEQAVCAALRAMPGGFMFAMEMG